MEHGFVNAQIGQPKIDIQKGNVKVTYPIREGERYQVRKVDVEGENLKVPKEKLIEGLELKPKSWFKRSLLADDIKNLTRLYNNMGYAYADVEPRQHINDEHGFIDMNYKITKGNRVRIERVDIVGNERTRDKVIRRVSGHKRRRSVQRGPVGSVQEDAGVHGVLRGRSPEDRAWFHAGVHESYR